MRKRKTVTQEFDSVRCGACGEDPGLKCIVCGGSLPEEMRAKGLVLCSAKCRNLLRTRRGQRRMKARHGLYLSELPETP